MQVSAADRIGITEKLNHAIGQRDAWQSRGNKAVYPLPHESNNNRNNLDYWMRQVKSLTDLLDPEHATMRVTFQAGDMMFTATYKVMTAEVTSIASGGVIISEPHWIKFWNNRDQRDETLLELADQAVVRDRNA